MNALFGVLLAAAFALPLTAQEQGHEGHDAHAQQPAPAVPDAEHGAGAGHGQSGHGQGMECTGMMEHMDAMQRRMDAMQERMDKMERERSRRNR
jgi:hypothetical protein